MGREYLLKGINDKNVKAYFDFMVENAIIFGANRTTAEIEMKDALEFEIKLANVRASVHLHFFFQIYNKKHNNFVVVTKIRFHYLERSDETQLLFTIHTQ